MSPAASPRWAFVGLSCSCGSWIHMRNVGEDAVEDLLGLVNEQHVRLLGHELKVCKRRRFRFSDNGPADIETYTLGVPS